MGTVGGQSIDTEIYYKQKYIIIEIYLSIYYIYGLTGHLWLGDKKVISWLRLPNSRSSWHNYTFQLARALSYVHSKYLTLYTDSSKMENGVAAAFDVFWSNEEIYNFRIMHIDKNTIYQAEMVPVLEAVHWYHRSNYNIFFYLYRQLIFCIC